ncbi:histidinol phosphatase-like enzyme (inositol monophosphatase family) [Hoeflea halophila]|uniref:Histidinol-phosphatase n=1 Tax=Hoeflea halophila TaxID=714899 RepID=A0A286IAM7_9HYPH|nr:histidinol-phosphatase [Hoeflea halophila]SOE16374.1 histidinol phosphatase-like enzyme (inositol monophosphatase family) [Hoeflea halophila]
MLPDISFLDAIAEAAAAETLPRFRMSVAVDNKQASGFDPVTEADRAAEKAIRELISERYPEHGILGEEHGDVGLDRDYVWVIDPIDGTRAFISGLPVWGTLVGLYHKGKAVMGMMDQPFTGERFIAKPGEAMVRRHGLNSGISTRKGVSLGQAIMMTTSPKIFSEALAPVYQRVEDQVQLARYGCDCYAYAMVASGHIDLVVEADLKPYDVGGLIPLVEQAGGVMTTWTGDSAEMGGTIVASGSAALHEEVLELLNRN